MIVSNFNDLTFFKEMTNVVKYAEGFLEGASAGKPVLLSKMGKSLKIVLEEYIDAHARVDPQSLHHVYEWYQTGSPAARLFDIDYVVSGNGLSFGYTFSQSRSVSSGSSEPFYNKASIMEDGVPITIVPRNAKVLAFENNGETIFTKGPVTVENPGGSQVQGSFRDVFDSFFNQYFSQSYLLDSGFTRHVGNPVDFKTNLSRAKTGGKSVGKQIGYNWIVKAGDKL